MKKGEGVNVRLWEISGDYGTTKKDGLTAGTECRDGGKREGLLLKENLEGVREQARRQTEMLTKQTEMLAEQEKTLNLIEGWCGEEKAELRREKESCEERLKKEFDERERELSEKLKSLENKIQEQIRQIKEMNDREETYKKELNLLKGGSSGRGI